MSEKFSRRTINPKQTNKRTNIDPLFPTKDLIVYALFDFSLNEILGLLPKNTAVCLVIQKFTNPKVPYSIGSLVRKIPRFTSQKVTIKVHKSKGSVVRRLIITIAVDTE